MKVHYYIFLLIFSTKIGIAQTHIYQHFGVDEGLPSSEVYDIYQDKQGYVWFATDKGLSRYNGYEFENFTTKDGLPGNTILDFYPQKNGEIWCYEYHTQSIFYFNETFDGFKFYKFNEILKKQFASTSVVKSILVENDDIFIGGYEINGFVTINGKGKLNTQFILPKGVKPNENEFDIGIKKNKNFFFSTNYKPSSESNTEFLNIRYAPGSRMEFDILNNNQIVFIDRKIGLFSKEKGVKYLNSKQNAIGIRKIDSNLFFVGYYSNGAEIRDKSGAIVESFLPNKSISSFLIDVEGSYWFSTLDDGIFYVKNPTIKMRTSEHISSLVKDENNNLYAGFHNGSIAEIGKKEINYLYKGRNDHPAFVEFDSENKELYGYADSRLKNYTNKQKSYPIGTSKIAEHVSNPLLVSSSNYYYSLKNDELLLYETKYKIQDVCSFNNITLLGTSAGLFVRENDIIKPFQPLKILKSRIDDIDLNKNTNTIYMASQGAGLIVYKDSIFSINKESGLTNNIISEVYIENDSIVWACSNSGLNRVVFKKDNSFTIDKITKSDGLLSNDIDDIEIINDTVWVATKKGLCYFNKDVLTDLKKSKVISLSINEVSINNGSKILDNSTLAYHQNTLRFNLQGINHKNTQKIKYHYRLKEIDTNWTVSTNRNIYFSSIPFGKYTFQAKATVSKNIQSKIVNYHFKILSPFWVTWWFISLCAILIIGLVYLFFKIRVLTYNQDIVRELMRLAIKRLKSKEQIYKFRTNGEDFKIPTKNIHYINSQGNYLDIVTEKKKFTIRCKIGDFINTTPDSLEYIRIHRSYIIRIDKITSKGKNWVMIKEKKIVVGETYLTEFKKIDF